MTLAMLLSVVGPARAKENRVAAGTNGLIESSLPKGPAVSADLAAFLGRWEGYSYSPPVKKDWKFVLVIQEITAQGGKAFFWGGTNLQYPGWVKEIQFSVVSGAPPAIMISAASAGVQGATATGCPSKVALTS